MLKFTGQNHAFCTSVKYPRLASFLCFTGQLCAFHEVYSLHAYYSPSLTNANAFRKTPNKYSFIHNLTQSYRLFGDFFNFLPPLVLTNSVQLNQRPDFMKMLSDFAIQRYSFQAFPELKQTAFRRKDGISISVSLEIAPGDAWRNCELSFEIAHFLAQWTKLSQFADPSREVPCNYGSPHLSHLLSLPYLFLQHLSDFLSLFSRVSATL